MFVYLLYIPDSKKTAKTETKAMQTPLRTKSGNLLEPSDIKEAFVAYVKHLFPITDAQAPKKALAELVAERRAAGVEDIFIGLHAGAQVGKTEVADRIQEQSGCEPIAYADSLKLVILEMFGLPKEYLTNDKLKEAIIPGLGMTFREIMQRFATDLIRAIDPDIWVRRSALKAHAMLAANESPQVILLTDCRFENEASLVRECGGRIVHIKGDPRKTNAPVSAESRPTDRAHPSEQPITLKDGDKIICNDSTLEDLLSRTDAMLKEIEAELDANADATPCEPAAAVA